MADEDSRRGVSPVVDADLLQQPDDKMSQETKTDDDLTETPKTNEVSPKESSNTVTGENEVVSKESDVNSSDKKDSEETMNKLARAREELNKAREEQARARDEVEKAKQDLAVATKDILQPNLNPVPEETISTPDASSQNAEIIDKIEVKEENQSDNANTTVESEVQGKLPGSDPSNPVETVGDSISICTAIETNTDKEHEIDGPSTSLTVESHKPSNESEAAVEEVKDKDNIKEDNLTTENIPNGSHSETTVSENSLHPVQQVEKLTDDKSSEDVLVSAEGEDADHGEDELEEGEHEEEEEDGELEGEHEEEEETVEGEREEGDGEESGEDGAAAKPLDDDEDRRNPQYIPKRGGFYEHDDRTREEGEEPVPEEPVVEEKPKKNRSEAIDRWGHDMFDPNQQGPKSNQELVDLYGYDIRQEEGAPRARRRRRYGRGPNKYDRTWEDETAYSRPRGRGGAAVRGGQSDRGSGSDRDPNVRPRPIRREVPKQEDFPSLSDTQDRKAQGEKSSTANWRDPDTAERRGNSKANAISFRRGGGGRTFEEPNKSKGTKTRSENSNTSQLGQSGDESNSEVPLKEHAKNPRRPTEAPSRGGASRGFGNRGSGPTRGGAGSSGSRGRGVPSSRGRRNGENSNWNKDDENSSRGDGHQHQYSPQGVQTDNRGPYEESRGRGRGKFGRAIEGNSEHTLQSGMEKMRVDDHASSNASRTQDAGRSKRYSSQRQRMTTPPPANTGAPMAQQPYPVPAGGSTAYYASYNDSPPPNYVSAAPAPMLPMAVAAQGAPPAFIAQPMYPAGPGPTPYGTGPYQGFAPAGGIAAAPPAVPVGVPIGSPTQDTMYGGGIMYYDPGRQPIRHGVQPTRRAKAAIPIVAPDNDVDGYLMQGRRPNLE